jgi:hypothetical protein
MRRLDESTSYISISEEFFIPLGVATFDENLTPEILSICGLGVRRMLASIDLTQHAAQGKCCTRCRIALSASDLNYAIDSKSNRLQALSGWHLPCNLARGPELCGLSCPKGDSSLS